MKIFKIFILIATILFTAAACEEEKIHRATSDDTVPPGQPTNIVYKPLYGGARFFYDIPADEDLMSIEASYTNKDNKTFTFSSSYFVDSLDVYGFGDTLMHKVNIYAVDRAGNRSASVVMEVKPMESAISRVVKSLELKPGFSSFFLDWKNELEQSINVYVNFNYSDGGKENDFTTVFSSNLEAERRFVEDLEISKEIPVSVKVRVADMFGNISDPLDMGKINLLEDIKIPKDNWSLPAPNDSVAGEPQGFGDGLEGRMRYVIDDIIDRGDNLNFMHTHSRGRTGRTQDGNMPWNVIIDLGDYYELSRIVTVQRHSGGLANVNRGQYYGSENVGIYDLYILDEDTNEWEFVTRHKIDVPVGLSELEFVKMGEAGDMAYMYPDNPGYTKAARWFRYCAVKSFNGNYTLENANCLSEITLYGRKAAR